MNISITGTLGSGKSSVCKRLEAKGFEILSNGILFRELAAEKGVTVVELNKLAETDKSIDKMLDERSMQLGKTKDHAVFDARMGWHFIPDSYKVFLYANINEAAQRVFHDSRVSEDYSSVAQAKEDLVKRQILEKERYLSLYQVDYLNLANYDLVIESTAATPDEVTAKILEYYEKNQRGILLNPTSVYPAAAGEKALDDGAKPTVSILKNSFTVVQNSQKLLKKIKEKEIFIDVDLSGDTDRAVADEHSLHAFEQAGDFQYKFYPEEDFAYLSYET